MSPTARTPAAGPLQRARLPARSALTADAPDRKHNILLAAERLFAEHGFHGVSVRDIAQAAGVPVALVNYHYGAKQQLYEAIFESWKPMLVQRLQALEAALRSRPAAQRLERIVEAFANPVLEMMRSDEGRCYARMAARDLAAPTPQMDELHRRVFDPMAHAFIDALCSLHPQATRAQVAWCYQFMLGGLLHFMTDRRVERLSHGEAAAADPQAQSALLCFIGAGVRAVLQPTQE